jgi:hypothetical protein
VKHFDDFHEDQFDFHAYCVRKVTLRAYTEVLRFEDQLWGEQYYFTAAKGIIGVYLHLYDNPAIMEKQKEPDYSQMNAAQRKKEKAVARKKKIQAEKKEAERLAKEAEANEESEEKDENGGQKKKGKSSPVDEDPNGKELLMKDPLEEAKNYSSILAKYAPKRFETWTSQYDVSIRRKKLLLALQAIFKMRCIDPENSEYFARLVDFALKLPTFGDIPDSVRSVATEESAALLNQKSVGDFVSGAADHARQGNQASLTTRVAIAHALVKTNPSSVKAAASLIVDGGLSSRGASVDNCRSALNALKEFGADAQEAKNKWIVAVKERFPLITDLS